jgi:Right handed beta helix region
MRKPIALLAFFLGACAAQALAASNIVYVAFYGSDSFPCTRAAPCKSITHALSIVASGGEVDIVGSGVCDNFTINKAVTVAAEPGVLASFDVPPSSNGITIATSGTDIVTLRRLNLHGQGGGNGVWFGSSGEVSVEDCVIGNFSTGITFVPSAAASLTVKGGFFDSNIKAINVCCATTGGAANVIIDGIKVELGSFGVTANAVKTTITRSSFSSGFAQAINVPAGTAILENNVISNYASGVFVTAAGTVYLSSNTITGNSVGVDVIATTNAFSRGNNTIVANGVLDVNGTLNPFSPQ